MVRGSSPMPLPVATGASSGHGLLPLTRYDDAQVLDVMLGAINRPLCTRGARA